ncbi:hydantoinase/carbamoylase family amidase [Mesorhizobium sp. BR1-1-16]|uniref:hydantoinase/carbamoylase family amidase n=1 Tax=Mesorhizobium sp. BR1-1-16 TaxID=2876653 RepID=UPI001CCD8326|nr:hydantoinase/carbamoylase family amidase [Mesorhizobium sp. BR1-1-16]MBZ9938371.1 hydantoinase/carbamoylase family amidase [Mesorhizobium sp. BR1-1-16]
MSPARVDGARLLSRLDAFAAIGGLANGGVDRPAFSLADRQARRLIADLALARGFSVAQDSVANLFIRRGADMGPPLLIGSHLDSQPTGGRFDGALGTLTAFEVLEALEDAGVETETPVELVVWSNEEGSRFAPGAMGSQAFAAGVMPSGEKRGVDGAELLVAIAETRAALAGTADRPLGFPIAGYLELHIEQGPILERAGIPIGAVEGIQGTTWLAVTMTGESSHAGTTPLDARRDAAAALIAALARLQDTIMPSDAAARFTAGRLVSRPDSINVVAQRASCTLDMRHPKADRLAAMQAEVRAVLSEAAATHGCSLDIEVLLDVPPAAFDAGMVAAVEVAAEQLRLPSRRMVSGAFHDALSMAAIAPSAMIFVPCRGGISHNEREFVEPDHVVAGAGVLLGATIEAARRLAQRGPAGAELNQRKRIGT